MEVLKVDQDDQEIELSLELSIGGIFRNFEKPKQKQKQKQQQQQQQIQQKSISSSITVDVESCEIDTNLRRENDICLCISSGVSPIGGADALDPKQQLMKREIHALRRQETRKKVEEKRKRRNNYILKNDDEGSERFCKKIKSEYGNQTQNLNTPPLPAFTFPPCPILLTQFVPFANPFAFPHSMTSYWAARTASSSSSSSPSIGDSEKNAVNCSGINSGSGSCSVSDSHNGTSSDTRSQSSKLASLQPQLHSGISNNAQSKSELSDSSHTTESTLATEEATSTGKIDSPSNTQSSQLRQIKEEPTNSVNHPLLINKTTSITKKNPIPRPPRTQSFVKCNKQQQTSQMLCVRTTGNGLNGKTINGFLHRYNKTDVSIMCACHGSSFTPAEFVKHAGGTDVSHSHPLKHIFVVPSS